MCVLAYEWWASPHFTSSEEIRKLDISDEPVRIRRPGNYIEPSVPHQFRAEVLVIHWRSQQYTRMIRPCRKTIHFKSPVLFCSRPIVNRN